MINDMTPKVDHIPVVTISQKGRSDTYHVTCPKWGERNASFCAECPHCRIDQGSYIACGYHRDEWRKDNHYVTPLNISPVYGVGRG